MYADTMGAEPKENSKILFGILVITMDCADQGAYEMAGSYMGEYSLSDSERNGASFLVPLYARKSGYRAGPSISVESGMVRLTNTHSITNVSCGILRIYVRT